LSSDSHGVPKLIRTLKLEELALRKLGEQSGKCCVAVRVAIAVPGNLAFVSGTGTATGASAGIAKHLQRQNKPAANLGQHK
jgi:hypothetical protein